MIVTFLIAYVTFSIVIVTFCVGGDELKYCLKMTSINIYVEGVIDYANYTE